MGASRSLLPASEQDAHTTKKNKFTHLGCSLNIRYIPTNYPVDNVIYVKGIVKVNFTTSGYSKLPPLWIPPVILVIFFSKLLTTELFGRVLSGTTCCAKAVFMVEKTAPKIVIEVAHFQLQLPKVIVLLLVTTGGKERIQKLFVKILIVFCQFYLCSLGLIAL